MKSISTSGHKFGLAPLGVGWVLWRDAADLPDDLIFHVTYLGGDMPVFQINFSRPAGQIVAQYYNFVRLGRDGYRNVHDACYATGKFLAEEVVKLGPFELLCDSDPLTGIPTVTWRIREGEDPGYTLYDIADRLRTRGWQVPAYPLTGSVSDISVQRILVRQGVSRDLAGLLLEDMEKSIAHFDRHPVTVPMTQGGVRRLQPPVAALPATGAPASPDVLVDQSTWSGRRRRKRGSSHLGRTVGRPRRGEGRGEPRQGSQRRIVGGADPGEATPPLLLSVRLQDEDRARRRPWRRGTRPGRR